MTAGTWIRRAGDTAFAPTLFPLGQVVATTAVDALWREGKVDIIHLVARHVMGDWGELDAHDRRENTKALKYGNRLLSAYDVPNVGSVWIITEADRSSTTILLPEEY